MSNMSYCRYHNTRIDLSDCFADARDHAYESAEYNVSTDEINQFKSMVEEMVEFLQELDIIDSDGEYNEEALDDICKKMKEVGE